MMRTIRMKKNSGPGRLVVFEGTDGSGKTTLLDMARDYLEQRLPAGTVVCTKQPTDLSRKTKLFQKMMYSRSPDVDYRAVQLLTLSDRLQHGHEVIEPALKAGKIVLSDRYVYTSIANMLARGYRKEDWFFRAARHIVRPDIAFLATVPVELAISRIESRPEEAGRYLNEALLKSVRERFLKMRRAARFLVLQTDGNAERAFSRVREALDKTIGGMAPL